MIEKKTKNTSTLKKKKKSNIKFTKYIITSTHCVRKQQRTDYIVAQIKAKERSFENITYKRDTHICREKG